jgi:succinyl-diaminopimelate desuccinylase
MKIDPVSLTADLVRCPSVTPEEGGAIDLLEQLLEKNGFSCTRIVRGQVSNLFAKWGTGRNGRVFGFNVIPMLFQLATYLPGQLIHSVQK